MGSTALRGFLPALSAQPEKPPDARCRGAFSLSGRRVVARERLVPGSGAGEPACKRGSVPRHLAVFGSVTIHLCSPPAGGARGRRTGSPSHDLALLRTGFTKPPRSLTTLVRSYRTLSPSPVPPSEPVGHRRSAFCCTVREVAPTWLPPASCPVEPRLSSGSVTRPPDPRSPNGLTSAVECTPAPCPSTLTPKCAARCAVSRLSRITFLWPRVDQKSSAERSPCQPLARSTALAHWARAVSRSNEPDGPTT